MTFFDQEQQEKQSFKVLLISIKEMVSLVRLLNHKTFQFTSAEDLKFTEEFSFKERCFLLSQNINFLLDFQKLNQECANSVQNLNLLLMSLYAYLPEGFLELPFGNHSRTFSQIITFQDRKNQIPKDYSIRLKEPIVQPPKQRVSQMEKVIISMALFSLFLRFYY